MNKYFFILILSIVFCKQVTAQEPEPIFNDISFYNSIDENNLVKFIKCINSSSADSCNNYFQFLDSLDYHEYLRTADGRRIKLTVITEKMASYADPGKQDQFLAMILYLEDQKHITKKLKDDLLEFIIDRDQSEVIAMYEIAKLRYNEGYIGLAHFLIHKLIGILPENNELHRLDNLIKKHYGNETYDASLTFEESIELNPHYIE